MSSIVQESSQFTNPSKSIAIDSPHARHDLPMSLDLSPHSLLSTGPDTESDDAEYSCPEDYDNELDHLVADIKDILGPTSGLDCNEIDVVELMNRIRGYKSNKSHWGKYAFFDAAHAYTRNGVDDINKKANLLILVWTPGEGSKVHDHANAHCIVKMLSGTLRETLYDCPNGNELTVKKVSEYTTNEVSYMSDTIGLHRMANPGSEPAVSLHLYTPPYASKFGCHVFDESTGESKLVSVSNLYSDNGIKNIQKATSC